MKSHRLKRLEPKKKVLISREELKQRVFAYLNHMMVCDKCNNELFCVEGTNLADKARETSL